MLRKSLYQLSFSVMLIFGLNSCTEFDKSKLENLHGGKVIKIGHGGSGFASIVPFNPYPANSQRSIEKALLENKADGVEVDVHMTADGKFVLYHDMKLDSKTNSKGFIEEQKYEDLVEVKYKVGFPFDFFQSEKIIGLADLISMCREMKEFPFLHFDLRNHSRCFTQEENSKWEKLFYHNLFSFLESESVPREKVLLISQKRSFLKYAIEQTSPFPLSLEEYGTFEEGIEWANQNGIKNLTFKAEKLSIEKTALAHSYGIEIVTFGGKSKNGNKKLLELNPDYIQSNNLSALQKLLN